MLNHKNFIISLLLPLFVGCGGGSGATTPISDAQTSNANVGSLTLAKCEEKYGNYTNQQWAESGYLEEGDEKNQLEACYGALISAPLLGQEPQLLIDMYNRGDYNNQITSNEPMVVESSDLTIDEALAKQDALKVYGDELNLNTLDSCKEKYGHFSLEEFGEYANIPRDVDIAVGQPMNGEAGYCMSLLVDSGYYSL